VWRLSALPTSSVGYAYDGEPQDGIEIMSLAEGG